MEIPLTISTPNELPCIVDALHDHWFDIDEIASDPVAHTLQIPFESEVQKSWFSFGRPPKAPVKYLLTVRNVQQYQINDTQKIGRYDFNELLYDSDKGMIRVTTGIPLDFVIFVSNVDMSICYRSEPDHKNC
jgi:hypothetical protein